MPLRRSRARDARRGASQLRRRVRRARRRRRTAIVVLLLALASVGLMSMNTPVRTPVGGAGVGRGSFPVVLVAGLGSTGENFRPLIEELEARGTEVLDLDDDRPGTQALVYAPAAGDGIEDVAVGTVQPAIRAALAREGYDARQVVDVVAHSMGGLVMRYLVEGDDAAARGWADQVDDLVLVATPNHGSDVIYWETHVRPGQPFGRLGEQMRPGSAFLRALGTEEPAGETYTAIGGDPWLFRWYRHGSHGFDNQVPTESAFLDGAALNTYDRFHGRLLTHEPVVRLIADTLAAR